MGDVLHLLLHV